MTDRTTITVHVSYLFTEEAFAGDLCVCGDEIYGKGFRLVMVTTVDQKIVPSFRETTYKLCQSCKEAMETK